MAARLTPLYNCAHFLTEAWLEETGQDISKAFEGFFNPRGSRHASSRIVNEFERIRQAQSPCIVLFRRGKATPHVGMFVRDRVFHLTERGPMRQPLPIASLGYSSVRFYAAR